MRPSTCSHACEFPLMACITVVAQCQDIRVSILWSLPFPRCSMSQLTPKKTGITCHKAQHLPYPCKPCLWHASPWWWQLPTMTPAPVPKDEMKPLASALRPMDHNQLSTHPMPMRLWATAHRVHCRCILDTSCMTWGNTCHRTQHLPLPWLWATAHKVCPQEVKKQLPVPPLTRLIV